MTNVIYPSSWFYKLYFDSKNNFFSNLISRLEIALLLENGAFISKPNIPTDTIFTQVLNVCSQDQHNTTENLTIENHFEAKIKQFFL